MDLNSVYKRSTRVAFRELDERFLIVPSIDNNNIGDRITYYTLNDVAEDVWKRLDGKKSLNEIGKELLVIYDIEPETLLGDIKKLLSDMEGKGVVLKVDARDGKNK